MVSINGHELGLWAGLGLAGAFLILLYVSVFVAMLVSRKSRNPEKSFKNHAVNMALYPMRAMKLMMYKEGGINIKHALKYAKKKTNLDDFGDPEMAFESSYQQIIDTATQKAQRYTNLGYISARIELNMTMVRRLKLVQYIKDCPQVSKVRVAQPVFVMGLPRTGTTLLHRLLSLDPMVRAPLLWELLAPVPGVKENGSAAMEEDMNKRALFVKKLMATRKSMGDRALEHIHEVGWNLPEECFLGLADEVPVLLQYFYSTYMHPELAEPLLRGRIVAAYTLYRKYLQLLSFQRSKDEEQNPRNWMLKCPIHLFYAKEIAQVFPDAKLVWTHRHPISAVPSMCSLLSSIHKLYYENECRDDHALGRTMLKVSEDLLVKAPMQIKESGLPCADVIYNSLVENPIKVVRDIYDQFGWAFTPAYHDALQNYLKEDKEKRMKTKQEQVSKGKNALHSYSPKAFGITAEALSSGGYKEYINRYNVPMSSD